METLMVRNMTRQAGKRLDADGKTIRNGQSRKRAMNRLMLRNGWRGCKLLTIVYVLLCFYAIYLDHACEGMGEA